jgi:hypothetical protein
MAGLLFHNNTVSMNDVWYESHFALLKSVCMELGQPDKINELQEKLLGNKMKIKKMKDPTLPKKAKSGFMFFCDEHRPTLIDAQRKKNKKVVISEVAKELGKKWGALKSKTKYDKLAAKDKERYAEAMSEYNEKNGLN